MDEDVRVLLKEVVKLEDDGVGTILEELDIGPSSSQGSADSKFLATYRFNFERPPQSCVLSPVHRRLHSEGFNGTVPLPKTTPQ